MQQINICAAEIGDRIGLRCVDGGQRHQTRVHRSVHQTQLRLGAYGCHRRRDHNRPPPAMPGSSPIPKSMRGMCETIAPPDRSIRSAHVVRPATMPARSSRSTEAAVLSTRRLRKASPHQPQRIVSGPEHVQSGPAVNRQIVTIAARERIRPAVTGTGIVTRAALRRLSPAPPSPWSVPPRPANRSPRPRD